MNQKQKKSREQSRISGTVKWFNAKNGYGFINRHDTNEDIFVHFSAISKYNPKHTIKSLGDGEFVEFNIMAVDVTGPGSSNVKGNPYVSHIPIRRYDLLAAGDSGMIRATQLHKRTPHDFSNSRIPRWTPIYRKLKVK
jgi:cold shock CspA family protein